MSHVVVEGQILTRAMTIKGMLPSPWINAGALLMVGHVGVSRYRSASCFILWFRSPSPDRQHSLEEMD